MRRTFTAVTLVLVGVLLVPAVPAPAFDLTPPAKSFEEERQASAEQHDLVVGQMGGIVESAELSAYVDRVGQKAAQHSDMPNEQFVFTVLNSPMVNAFTTGGGYVYVTRGILGVMNSEAELAAVIGHEIGHCTGRHTARRETRMKLGKVEDVLVALLTGSLRWIMLDQIDQTRRMTAYSREQEWYADREGFEITVAAGYDPYGLANMLGGLERYVALETRLQAPDTPDDRRREVQLPSWLMDHPPTDERIAKARDRARKAEAKAASFRAEYLEAIDGMIYGEDPAQGMERDGVFVHTDIGFAFDVPEGLVLQNLPLALVGGKGDDLGMVFTGATWPARRSLREYAAQTWLELTSRALGRIDRIEERQINGMEAIVATKRVEVLSTSMDLTTVVYRLSDAEVFHFSFMTTPAGSTKHRGLIEAVTGSFRRLDDEERAKVKPLRIRVVDVGPGDTIEGLAARMPFDELRRERFEMLNAITTDDELRAAKRVKLILSE